MTREELMRLCAEADRRQGWAREQRAHLAEIAAAAKEALRKAEVVEREALEEWILRRAELAAAAKETT